MKVVLANITISTGGVLRLNKDLMNQVGIQPGDKIVVMKESERPEIPSSFNGTTTSSYDSPTRKS